MTILPKDINTKQHFFNTFDKYETEISARLLIKYCQEQNKLKWPEYISKKALDKWVNENFWFNGLDDKGFTKDNKGFIKRQGDKIFLTPDFIAKCYIGNHK